MSENVWLCLCVLVPEHEYAWFMRYERVLPNDCVKAWSVHMILKGVWKRNIEKKMVHEMLKMLLVQVQSIKVLSKNRFCS